MIEQKSDREARNSETPSSGRGAFSLDIFNVRSAIMRRDLIVVPQGTPEDKLIDLWVRLKKSEHTQRAYRRDIEVFRAFVEKPLAEVTLEDALDFCDNLDEI